MPPKVPPRQHKFGKQPGPKSGKKRREELMKQRLEKLKKEAERKHRYGKPIIPQIIPKEE